MFRSRSWFGGGLWRPKNPHSLEHLKYLYNVLSKNQTVSETNRGLLVETLRSIAEILIWGDQNDSSVFDFFLEKNMLSFFLRIMKQKCGSYVCVQLLQTLNILFENIRNETSLYYLLSNNHVNSIIVHKFDFSDEEVMAYYISFLKTLSLKLNAHTIHFFYNEHTNDFPLYTEAIKFFNHSEGMVRIAVRTLTLNVYRVEDASMLRFIRDKTAAPYFSNLVWFIGNHILELDTCVRTDADHQSQNRLADLVAEHLDHLHYLNDILCLNIEDLNKVLSEHLLHKLLVPLYVYSLTRRKDLLCDNYEDRKYVSTVVALFLLSQVFLIISHGPLVKTLAAVILKSNVEIIKSGASKVLEEFEEIVSNETVAFLPPKESLEKSLECASDSRGDPSKLADVQEEENENEDATDVKSDESNNIKVDEEIVAEAEKSKDNTERDGAKLELGASSNAEGSPARSESSKTDATSETVAKEIKYLSVSDEEKEQRLALEGPLNVDRIDITPEEESVSNKPFLEAILNSLYCQENDYAALFALCILYALANNKEVHSESLGFSLAPNKSSVKNRYNETLIDKIIHIITLSCQSGAKVRLVTLELAIKLLLHLVICDNESILQDCHLAAIEAAKEQSTALLRNFYKSEDIFLDMFEDEYGEIQKKPLKVEWLMMDSNILLPPTGTPMTGIEFSKRLACGEVERARRAIRVFFLIRELSLTLYNEVENQLPLTNPGSCVQVNNVLDLSNYMYNSDLIACTVVWKDGQKIRRFLVIDSIQLILVEPDARKLGWGIAKFVGFLQDIEVVGDKDDSRCLHLTIHKPSCSGTSNKVPLLSAKFIFDDHIRCMAAKQRLTKGRIKARQKKMTQIAKLLDIPTSTPQCSTPTNYSLISLRDRTAAGGRAPHHRSSSMKDQQQQLQQRLFQVNKVPGFAAQMRRDSYANKSLGSSSSGGGGGTTSLRHVDRSPTGRVSSQEGGSGARTRENSPKLPRPRSEEIPLEDMRLRKTSLTSNSSSQQDDKDSAAVTMQAAATTSAGIVTGQNSGSSSNSSTASGQMVEAASTSRSSSRRSEETSFMERQSSSSSHHRESRPRRKGQVETV
ncbi:protein CLEC16A homolog isoform X2 [Trichogramma pretiosum]|uniref:protein CLEC16A homolog isoform X2 n=1 Tax=Trichogramma pretiosum TaxID=7493 RepID=UPI0006C99DEF|nr:protein CLEC16A homolog isoform X2 [Trichogramma pretiosum]